MTIRLSGLQEREGNISISRSLLERYSKPIEEMLQSEYEDEIVMDIRLYNRLVDRVRIKKEIATKLGIIVRISSGLRTPKINKEVGGAPDSQHLYGEAMDLKFFYENGGRIMNKVLLTAIATEIDLLLGHNIQQLLVYLNKGFIHIGFSTSRKCIRRSRNFKETKFLFTEYVAGE